MIGTIMGMLMLSVAMLDIVREDFEGGVQSNG
jgi:hypothetical protein